MKKCLFILLSVLTISPSIHAIESKEKSREVFSDAEANFKIVMQKLLDRYLDKSISKDDLYRAATAGMLDSLNPGEHTWNKLLSPSEFREIRADLLGQVTGIGAELKFDEGTGYAQVLRVIPRSPGEKAGLKKDDQVLSVDGKRYKGKQFRDLIAAIRGNTGASVDLKVLRDDKIVSLNVKRDLIPWTPVDLSPVDDSTQLLTIGYFTEETPKLVEEKIKEVNGSRAKRLIVDVRDNSGGGFDQAIKVAEIFVPKEAIVAVTSNRNNQIEKFKSTNGLLRKDIQLVLLTNKGTFCAAELLVAAIKENREAKIVGETTSGKWNAQTVETLPNGFAIKYTVKAFQSPQGHSYQDLGIKPDLEVSLPKETEARELRLKYEISKRLSVDTQLKAAYELARAM